MRNRKIEANAVDNVRWALVLYDGLILAMACAITYFYFIDYTCLTYAGALSVSIMSMGVVFASRFIFRIYSQVWRYGGVQSYLKLLASDLLAFIVIHTVNYFISPEAVAFLGCISVSAISFYISLCIRMVYRYAYKFGNTSMYRGRVLRFLLKVCTFGTVKPIGKPDVPKIKVAIVGAGNVGIALSEELVQNSSSPYVPMCFIDINNSKIGREIKNLPVFAECDSTLADLESYGIQEVVIAISTMSQEKRSELYHYYKNAGYKVKVYDFPALQNANQKKRQLREFDVEELLFRNTVNVLNEKTMKYYEGKVVLITGGGGSIGSELCRQIAKMHPERLVILDVYENGAYDIQQELRIHYGKELKINVEIVSVTNREGLERVFQEYRPNLVLNAAAHKHVPLMEKNCIEAVENNVFGTLNTVELSEKYGVERVIMVSTDKAVNPTNIMGATKRMCEMIVQAHSVVSENTTFSSTRFGNVLGSAGSVIPLFRKQISHGGPVTITDKRIIRYFMTIPEASQLVLTSGAMAKNGELFVLDMGQPVKILELAENMIRLMGLEPDKDIEILETGLRPGEKLYEELLVKTEELDKTENELIFIERDNPISMDELNEKLEILKAAISTNSDEAVREALMNVVPTFRKPEEVNSEAIHSKEMQNAK